MKAAIFHGVKEPLTIEEIEIDAPKAREVVVKTVASGVCHSDLHFIEGLYPFPSPAILGHEAAGIVEAVGPGVTEFKPGDHVLFHAAAGGVGLLFGQWAKARGYRAIGTVSSPAKAALAKKNGYKWVIDYSKEDVVAKVKEITKGKGVPVVFDGVGKDTWMASLDRGCCA